MKAPSRLLILVLPEEDFLYLVLRYPGLVLEHAKTFDFDVAKTLLPRLKCFWNLSRLRYKGTINEYAPSDMFLAAEAAHEKR